MAEWTEKDEELVQEMMQDPPEDMGPLEVENILPPIQVAEIIKHGKLIPGIDAGLSHVPEELLELIYRKGYEFLLGFACCAQFLNSSADYFIYSELSKKALETPEEPASELELNAFTYVTTIQGLLYNLCVLLAKNGYIDDVDLTEEDNGSDEEAEDGDGGDSAERPDSEEEVREPEESEEPGEAGEEVQADAGRDPGSD